MSETIPAISITNPASARKLTIFSGGSAANSLIDVFNNVSEDIAGSIKNNACSLSYVLPISDNGGSSSELIRVFGGPGIGDVRSRLVRLIPQNPQYCHIRNLFNHRLPPSPEDASAEFMTILTGDSPLCSELGTAQAMLIRSILSHLHLEILKRSRPPSSFNFQSASIGNLLLTGARLFSGSFESAIYLLALIGGVDESKTAVLPSIVSNFSHHICAGLADGSIIAGQNDISHPNEPTALDQPRDPIRSDNEHHQANGADTTIEDANLPGSLATLRKPNITFSKSAEAPLPARIERIWYINPYGQEMRPSPNPKMLEAISRADAIIYSIGSLYTSIVPSLILQGVGARIAHPDGPRFKIMILNGSLDRETAGFTASDFLDAITSACMESQSQLLPASSSFPSSPSSPSSPSPNNNRAAVRTEWSKYITHLIHLEGDGVPVVDKDEMSKRGVECMRLYGRKGEDGVARYDGKALAQALGLVLGKRERKERSRRNTLDG